MTPASRMAEGRRSSSWTPIRSQSRKKVDARPSDQARSCNADSDLDPDEPPAKAQKTISGPLEWLLSDEAFNMANPEVPEGHGEVDIAPGGTAKTPPPEEAGKKGDKGDAILRYPQSDLTPFQNLVSACILSKPLSHRLGLRTIQTLLNPPFGLRTLKDLDEAGYEGRRKVMWEARTQHKEKTASQLGDVVDGIRDLCGEKDDETELDHLEGLRDSIRDLGSPKEVQDALVDKLTTIKGIGPGVASIFLRRIQGDWEEVYPYADDRCLKSARAFGLIDEKGGASELAEKVGKGDRRKFVRVLDTLIGIELEKKLDEGVKQAGV